MSLDHNSDFCNKIKGQPSDGDVHERKLWHDFKIAMQGGAVITGDYRYLLWREWDISNKTVSFIMLNPSRADAQINDPTITRCINFALSWGYGRLEVVNLFASSHIKTITTQTSSKTNR